MANSIALAKIYQKTLDEVYKVSSLTRALDAPAGVVRDGMQANEVLIPKISMQGLGNNNRNADFVDGDVTFEYQTHQFTQERNRSFQIAQLDNMETLDTAFASLVGQFVRDKVVPEVDAYRFSTLFSEAGTSVEADLTLSTALDAIDDGIQVMMDAEVPKERIVIYLTPEIYKYLKKSDEITRQFVVNQGNMMINREIETLDGHPIIVVPQSRFYTSITLYDGTTGGQEAGGYIKTAVTGKDLNFLLVDPAATLGITKTALPRIFSPEVNQKRHAYKFDYLLYHDLFVLDNKVNGIYAHNKTT